MFFYFFWCYSSFGKESGHVVLQRCDVSFKERDSIGHWQSQVMEGHSASSKLDGHAIKQKIPFDLMLHKLIRVMPFSKMRSHFYSRAWNAIANQNPRQIDSRTFAPVLCCSTLHKRINWWKSIKLLRHPHRSSSICNNILLTYFWPIYLEILHCCTTSCEVYKTWKLNLLWTIPITWHPFLSPLLLQRWILKKKKKTGYFLFHLYFSELAGKKYRRKTGQIYAQVFLYNKFIGLWDSKSR
jgi:hypothetical protein